VLFYQNTRCHFTISPLKKHPIFIAASNIAYANDTMTWHSIKGLNFQLFSNTID
jgi:hypothetical protein